jgi:hypothetical protein
VAATMSATCALGGAYGLRSSIVSMLSMALSPRSDENITEMTGCPVSSTKGQVPDLSHWTFAGSLCISIIRGTLPYSLVRIFSQGVFCS